VAVPVCHEASNTNITIIFFSIRRYVVGWLVGCDYSSFVVHHLRFSLFVSISTNTTATRIVMRPQAVEFLVHMSLCAAVASVNSLAEDCLVARSASSQPEDSDSGQQAPMSRSEHITTPRTAVIRHQRVEHTSITGAKLDLQWRQLHNVEYLTDGGNSWIHTAVFNGKPVVVKTLKPECQDVALAINEIEGELGKWLVSTVFFVSFRFGDFVFLICL
jgi:hypothetical protein